MKRIIALATFLLLCVPVLEVSAQGYVVPSDTPANIRRAVESTERTQEMLVRDAARLPAEVLTLAGLEEGDHIAEISSFGQYYTTLLTAAVGPEGKVDMYDMPYMEQFGATEAGKAFSDTHPNTSYNVVHYSEIDFADNLDGVYVVLYYHDFMPQGIDPATFNEKVFAALRPGGKYLVIDHKAEAGSGWRDAGTIHRMDTQVIIDEVTAAGFDLIVDSDILAHPADDKSVMVFSPGTRGGTDRSVFVFRKP